MVPWHHAAEDFCPWSVGLRHYGKFCVWERLFQTVFYGLVIYDLYKIEKETYIHIGGSSVKIHKLPQISNRALGLWNQVGLGSQPSW